MPVLLGGQGIGTGDALNGVPERKAGEHQLRIARIQAAEGQQILNNVGHAVRLRDDDVQKAVGGLHRDVSGKIVTGVPDGLGIAADVGEGGAQLVGDIGHELLAPLLVAVLLRHVMKHHQHAAAGLVGKRRQKQLQRPVPHLHLRLGVVGSLEGQGLLEGIDLTEEGIVGSALRHTAVEHVGGGGQCISRPSWSKATTPSVMWRNRVSSLFRSFSTAASVA